jgi:2-polyprenyl-3-methyl-5-hydroxy-6-metoxy-1,4-benzoquinol methylase
MVDVEETNTLALSILEKADAYHRWVFGKVKGWLGERVLEVGCGTGNLTGLLLCERKVIASDVNPNYLRAVKDKFRDQANLTGTLQWDLKQTPPDSLRASIDTIVASNVLEHVRDDNAVLRRFHHLLPLGGKVIVMVPALKMLYNSLDRSLGHFRRYNKRELMTKLMRNRFSICYLTYFNLFGIFGWFLNGTLLHKRLLSEKQVRIFNTLVPAFMEIEKIIPTFVGQSLVIVGEKV